MIEQSVQLDPRQVRQVRRGYRGAAEALPKAVNRAIPVVGRKSRVVVVKAIRANVNVPANKLYQRGNRQRPISDRSFKVGGMAGYRLTIDKGRLPLGRFQPRQHWKGGASGGRVRTRVSYKINADGGRQKLYDAFALEFTSGYIGVFRRQGDPRLPLQELYGPSIPEVAENDSKVQRQVEVQAGEDLVTETESRLDFILSRAA